MDETHPTLRAVPVARAFQAPRRQVRHDDRVPGRRHPANLHRAPHWSKLGVLHCRPDFPAHLPSSVRAEPSAGTPPPHTSTEAT
jgi:hypothetical protein